MPLLSHSLLSAFFGETKASKIVSSENQLFVQNKQSKRLQFSDQLNPNKLNLNFDNFFDF